jgi:hypothetical protein
VERFSCRSPRSLLDVGAGTGETAAFLTAAGNAMAVMDMSRKIYLQLLIEGTGLRIVHGGFDGSAFDHAPGRVSTTSPIQDYEGNNVCTVILARQAS